MEISKKKKMAFQISLSGRSSELNLEYNEGIKLNQPYDVCLKSFVTYNNIPNITSCNNKIFMTNGSKQVVITFPTGTYELADINNFLQAFSGNKEPQLKITLNKVTLKVEISCKWTVDFTEPNTMGSTLGFKNQKIYGSAASDMPVQLFTIQTIKIKCNLIKSNIDNLKMNDNTLHEFPLSVDPGEKIVERPTSLCYYPMSIDTIYQLHIRIVDQDNRLVDFQGEKISLNLGFEPR